MWPLHYPPPSSAPLPSPQSFPGLGSDPWIVHWHTCTRPSLAVCLPMIPQLCPSDGHSCVTSICQTTLWRKGECTEAASGEQYEREGVGCENGPVCLSSRGTSCVSQFLKTIKRNELFHVCSGATRLSKYLVHGLSV